VGMARKGHGDEAVILLLSVADEGIDRRTNPREAMSRSLRTVASSEATYLQSIGGRKPPCVLAKLAASVHSAVSNPQEQHHLASLPYLYLRSV